MIDADTSGEYIFFIPRYNCLKYVCSPRVVEQWPLIIVQDCRWVHAWC